MAEKQPKQDKQEQGKKKFPFRTILVVLVFLLLELGTVGLMAYFAGEPATVNAAGEGVADAARAEQPVELLLVEDRFQNTRTGHAYVYDTEIYVVTMQKNEELIGEKLERQKATVTTRIATIFRRADLDHLREPELSTLTRQILAAMNEQLGYDEDGKPYVQKVLIRKCMQFRADL
ncbi:MAG: hypothetical protein ACOCTI_07790 [Phycisphaeraceae bacterium]